MSPRSDRRSPRRAAVAAVRHGISAGGGGCNMTAGLMGNPRTPTEQLLLTQSLLRSLDGAALPIRSGEFHHC